MPALCIYNLYTYHHLFLCISPPAVVNLVGPIHSPCWLYQHQFLLCLCRPPQSILSVLYTPRVGFTNISFFFVCVAPRSQSCRSYTLPVLALPTSVSSLFVSPPAVNLVGPIHSPCWLYQHQFLLCLCRPRSQPSRPQLEDPLRCTDGQLLRLSDPVVHGGAGRRPARAAVRPAAHGAPGRPADRR